MHRGAIPTLVLVRHCRVADRFRELCYGRSDIELSDEGMLNALALVETLSQWPITNLWHSGLRRTRAVAEPLGKRLGILPIECAALAELDFGEWELRPWQELFERHGDAMGRILSEPDAFRPGGGETIGEMRDRAVRWLDQLEPAGLTVAIAHGGPIAALRGVCRGYEIARWPELIPPYGNFVRFEAVAEGWRECGESSPPPTSPTACD